MAYGNTLCETIRNEEPEFSQLDSIGSGAPAYGVLPGWNYTLV